MNVAGVCNYDPATVILAHFRWLGDCGEAFKPTDLQAQLRMFGVRPVDG